MRAELASPDQRKENIGCLSLFQLSFFLEGHVVLKDKALPATGAMQLGVNLQDVPIAIYVFPGHWQNWGEHSLTLCALCPNIQSPVITLDRLKTSLASSMGVEMNEHQKRMVCGLDSK